MADHPATDGEGTPTEREWLEGVAADRLPDPVRCKHGYKVADDPAAEACIARFGALSAAVSPAEPPEARAQAVQRGLEPAETLLELVDAIRQDTAGIGACLSSIRFIAESRGDVPKSILEWLDRLASHTQRLEGKCALALTGERS